MLKVSGIYKLTIDPDAGMSIASVVPEAKKIRREMKVQVDLVFNTVRVQIDDRPDDEIIDEYYKKLHAGQIQVEPNVTRMQTALQHCGKVFQSLAQRGRYPEELLPDTKYYLGIQGFQFIYDAIGKLVL